jgi:hypothetical protein
LIPVLALLSNYDQENCLINVGTEGFAGEHTLPLLTKSELKVAQNSDRVFACYKGHKSPLLCCSVDSKLKQGMALRHPDASYAAVCSYQHIDY